MNKKFSLKEMLYSSVFAALIAVLSQVALPLAAMPVTLQTFAVALCGYVIGTKLSVISLTVYIALGAVGVPVFTGFKGGLQCLAGPTGGFIIGFIALAALSGLRLNNAVLRILLGVVGLAVCHIFGFVQYSFVAGTGIAESFLLVSAPFLIKDIISVVAAYFLSLPIRKALKSDLAY